MFLIAQEYYKSWKELHGWCLKYRENNLFEMEKLRDITSYAKCFSWAWPYNGSSGGTELSSHSDYKHKCNKSSRQYILLISILNFNIQHWISIFNIDFNSWSLKMSWLFKCWHLFMNKTVSRLFMPCGTLNSFIDSKLFITRPWSKDVE